MHLWVSKTPSAALTPGESAGEAASGGGWHYDPMAQRVGEDLGRVAVVARASVGGAREVDVTPSGRDPLVVMMEAADLGDVDHGTTICRTGLAPPILPILGPRQLTQAKGDGVLGTGRVSP